MLKLMASSAGARIMVLPLTAVAAALTSFLIINYAGSTAFGAVSLIGNLFLLVPFADLGLGAAIVNAVAGRERTAGTHDSAATVVRAAFGWLVVSGAALALVATLAAATGSLSAIAGLNEADYPLANLAILAAVVPFATALPFGVGQRILLGLDKNHLVNIYSALTPLTSLAVTVILIYAHVEPLFLACATPIGILAAAVLAFFMALRKAGWNLHTIMDRPARALPRAALWHAAAPMMIISIMTPAGQQSGRLVLSHLGSPTQLAEYALAFQFYIPTLSIATSAGVALWPIFARDRSSNRNVWRKAVFVMTGLGFVLACGYGTLIAPVAALVSQGKIIVEPQVAGCLAILLLVMAMLQVPGMLLTTPRLLAFQAVCTTVMAIITLTTSIALTPLLGATGPILGAVIGVTVGQLVPGLICAHVVLRGEQ